MRRILSALLILPVLAACSPVAEDGAEGGPQEYVNLRWEFTSDPTVKDDVPLTDVSLVVTGIMERKIELGTFSGSGADVTGGAWEEPVGSLMTAVLWWAGGGDELSVHRPDPATLIVRRRTIDEEAGYGEFEDLETISVPPQSTVIPAE
jgi:hypothetical protein